MNTEIQIVSLPEERVNLVAAFLRGLPSDSTRAVCRQVIGAFTSFLCGVDLTAATRRQIEAYRSLAGS